MEYFNNKREVKGVCRFGIICNRSCNKVIHLVPWKSEETKSSEELERSNSGEALKKSEIESIFQTSTLNAFRLEMKKDKIEIPFRVNDSNTSILKPNSTDAVHFVNPEDKTPKWPDNKEYCPDCCRVQYEMDLNPDLEISEHFCGQCYPKDLKVVEKEGFVLQAKKDKQSVITIFPREHVTNYSLCQDPKLWALIKNTFDGYGNYKVAFNFEEWETNNSHSNGRPCHGHCHVLLSIEDFKDFLSKHNFKGDIEIYDPMPYSTISKLEQNIREKYGGEDKILVKFTYDPNGTTNIDCNIPELKNPVEEELFTKLKEKYKHKLSIYLRGPPPYVAFVKKLSVEVDETSLRNFFADHNCNVENVEFMQFLDSQTKNSKVTFKDIDSLEKALKADGFELRERSIRVDVYKQKTPTEPRVSRAGQVDKWGRGKTPQERPGRSGKKSKLMGNEVSRADQVDKWGRGKTVATPQERPGDRKFGRDDRRCDRCKQ